MEGYGEHKSLDGNGLDDFGWLSPGILELGSGGRVDPAVERRKRVWRPAAGLEACPTNQ